MGCCGGGGAAVAPTPTNNSSPNFTTLDQYDERDKIWVLYNGDRRAAFPIRGAHTGVVYQILGKEHRFEVHRLDIDIFQRSAGGKEFSVGVGPPEELSQEPASQAPRETESISAFIAPEPELGTIVRLDQIAADSRGIALEPAPSIPPEPVMEPTITEVMPPTTTLADLTLRDSVRKQFEGDGLTVEELAAASAPDLIKYKGVGLVTAAKIIEQARSLTLPAMVIS